jgi:starvation-inducible DNA-binding protein
MRTELYEDNRRPTSTMRQAHRLCDEHSDIGTASLLEGWIDAAEQRAWSLREVAQRP